MRCAITDKYWGVSSRLCWVMGRIYVVGLNF
ncbi:Uncharacterised protein [Vibrio cholerae]|nr:Uncharacterised protein [Vibrio cholerae]